MKCVLVKNSGKISGTYQGPASMLEVNLRGRTAITVPPPSRLHTWDFVNETWVAPTLSVQLNKLVKEKLSHFRQIRNEKINGGFNWSGSSFDSNLTSRMSILFAAMQAADEGNTFSVTWTLADNSVRTLSATDMKAIATRLSKFMDNQQTTYRALKIQLQNVTTLAELDAVQWPSP